MSQQTTTQGQQAQRTRPTAAERDRNNAAVNGIIKAKPNPSLPIVHIAGLNHNHAASPFPCLVCGDRFTRREQLRGHFWLCVQYNGNPNGVSMEDEPNFRDPNVKDVRNAGIMSRATRNGSTRGAQERALRAKISAVERGLVALRADLAVDIFAPSVKGRVVALDKVFKKYRGGSYSGRR